MIDTNQDPGQTGDQVKKKKQSPKKTVSRNKDENKGDKKPAVRNLPEKKENKPVKSPGGQKVSTATKGQTITNLRKFFKGAWSELKKVHWPGRRELVAFTSVVLVAVTLIAVLIFLFDTVLSELLAIIIPK